MEYTKQDVINFIYEEDVKFIRLAFCDIFGVQKNISILPSEIGRAFEYGIAFDASSIDGFGEEVKSDLFLKPNPNTLTILPWRPEHGRVIRLFCDIVYPNGEIFECDTRNILKKAIMEGKKHGIDFKFGAELEFYLFKLDEYGESTKIPYDNAKYMDVSPVDRGENIRREICLNLEQMNIMPECSHHEEGPGQNEIDFRYDDPLNSADNAIAFKSVVQTVARINGVSASFEPKPLENKAGNGFHINISAKCKDKDNLLDNIIAGVIKHIKEITIFLNPSDSSYIRLGECKAPKYISWSEENRSQLLRVPASMGEYKRVELRSPDPLANPYLAFALLIYSAIEGITNNIQPPKAQDINFFRASEEVIGNFDKLPKNLEEAKEIMKKSEFVKKHLPKDIVENYVSLVK